MPSPGNIFEFQLEICFCRQGNEIESFQEGCSPLGFAGDGLERCSVQQPAKVGLQPFLICQLVEWCLCRPSTVVPAAVGSTLVAEFLGNVNEMKHELEAAAFGASKHGHGSVPLGSTRSSRRNLRPLDRTRVLGSSSLVFGRRSWCRSDLANRSLGSRLGLGLWGLSKTSCCAARTVWTAEGHCESQ